MTRTQLDLRTALTERAATTPVQCGAGAQVRARIVRRSPSPSPRHRGGSVARWLSSPRSPCSRRSWAGVRRHTRHRPGDARTRAPGRWFDDEGLRRNLSSCPASPARDARPGLGRASHRRGQLGGGLAERHAFGQHIHSHELGPGRELRCEPACKRAVRPGAHQWAPKSCGGPANTLPAAAQAHRKDRIRKKASYWSERFNVRHRRAVDDRRARRRRERSAGARPSAEHHVSGGVYADTTIQHRDHED